MRPDRLVVGEVRGAEVVDLLAALNTGHEGGCGTVHANAAADVPARMEALALAAGLDRRRRTASSRPRSTSCCTWRAPRRRAASRSSAVPSRRDAGLVTMVPRSRSPPTGGARWGAGAELLADRLADRDRPRRGVW